MNKDTIVVTQGARKGQITVITLSAIIIIVLSTIFVNKATFASFLVLIVALAILLPVNISMKKQIDIKIQGYKVILENLWIKKSLQKEEIIDIVPLKFVFFYPFNPFIKIVTKDKTNFYSQIGNAERVYLPKGGIRQHIKSIKEKIGIFQ